MTFDRMMTGKITPTLLMESRLWDEGVVHVAGVDEAGRGPLAGPVVAAAVIFPRGVLLPGVADSKLLSSKQREALCCEIRASALAVGTGVVDHTVIDRINILNATYEAMHQAIANLGVVPDHVLVDGNRFRGNGIPFTTIIDGDALCFSVAAASIIAKVERDGIMEDFDRKFPGYGFAKHKGYGTVEHRDAIRRLGYCEIHRRSFAYRREFELNVEKTGEQVHDTPPEGSTAK